MLRRAYQRIVKTHNIFVAKNRFCHDPTCRLPSCPDRPEVMFSAIDYAYRYYVATAKIPTRGMAVAAYYVAHKFHVDHRGVSVDAVSQWCNVNRTALVVDEGRLLSAIGWRLNLATAYDAFMAHSALAGPRPRVSLSDDEMVVALSAFLHAFESDALSVRSAAAYAKTARSVLDSVLLIRRFRAQQQMKNV